MRLKSAIGWVAVLATIGAIGVMAYLFIGGAGGIELSSLDDGPYWPMWVFFIAVPVALIAGVVWTVLFAMVREAPPSTSDDESRA